MQAVGSSTIEKGQAFIAKHAPSASPSPKVYSSYAQVYNDPDVDIVYIGTPHALHLANALDAINAGKHVLCEKPMTINEREADILIAAARKKGVFVMEGLLPSDGLAITLSVLREWIWLILNLADSSLDSIFPNCQRVTRSGAHQKDLRKHLSRFCRLRS